MAATGDTGKHRKEGQLLDMTIWHDGTQWQSKLYDKKAELISKGLKINKFPHVQSKITTKCKYGVITSQLHRYNQVCTKTKFFMAAATDLYATFIKKGYQNKKVDAYFAKFIMQKFNRGTNYIHPKAVQRRYNMQICRDTVN